MGVVRPPRSAKPAHVSAGVSSTIWMSVRRSGNRPTSAATGSPILARLARTSPNLRIAGYVIAVAGTALVTIAFLPIRDDITPLSKGFAYLAVVVAAAATGSLGPGIVASVLGFLSLQLLLPPAVQPVDDRPARVRGGAVRVPRALGHHLGAPGARGRACPNRGSSRSRAPHDPGAQPRADDPRARRGHDRGRPAHGEAGVRLPGRGAVRRADRGRPRPGPAGDGRRRRRDRCRRRGTLVRRSGHPNGSRCPSGDGCSGSSS